MEIRSDSHFSLTTEAPVRPSEAELSPEDTKASLIFINKASASLETLIQAMLAREVQIKRDEATATRGSKIWAILFPSSLDEKVVKEISSAAKRSFLYLNMESGVGVRHTAKQLHAFRVSNPKEFKIALPGLEAKDVTLICHSLAALGRVWETFYAFQAGDPKGVESNVNRAYKHILSCGVPADDSSLNRFRSEYLAKAQALRAQALIAPAA